MYAAFYSEQLEKKFDKLLKKNKKQLYIIYNKIQQILENPYHFKPLKGDLHGTRRVHIDKSFVLTYEIYEKNKMVKFLDFDHHGKIYR